MREKEEVGMAETIDQEVFALRRRVAELEALLGEDRRAGETLRTVASRYRAILAAVPDIIMEVDDRKVYTWANTAGREFFGDDVLGREAAYYFEGEQDTYASIEPMFGGDEGVFYLESWQRRKDGAKRLLAWWCRVLKDDRGDVSGALSSARDITDIRRSEEERARLKEQVLHGQKLESLGILAGGIAHDFNNLLVGVLGNADLARNGLPERSPALDYIAAIEASARRAADLCRQMLAYSGRGHFVVCDVDLGELVNEMSHLLEVSVSKKADVVYEFAENLPAIEADATQVRQVVMNLLTNASEALGSKSGRIEVRTGAAICDRAHLSNTYVDDDLPAGPYIFLEITDDGQGMDEETRVRLFEPFFTTKFTGRGLGMAAVLGIVRGHRGAIDLTSVPGRGTSVRVLFPSLERPAQPQASEPVADPGWRGSGLVLLVDDDPAVLDVCVHMLQRTGFDVITARDGREAVALFHDRRDDIDCVVLDLTMPHMDGEETFLELRRMRREVPVILSSGFDDQEIARRYAGEGFAGFLKKPYVRDEVAARVREALAR